MVRDHPVKMWFLFALVVRLAITLQGLSSLDRVFIYDDTYYSLAIARNIARGFGPSVDGLGLTNGFQPLVTFLQVPLFWLSGDPDFAVRGAVLETAVFGACGVAALGALLARVAGGRAAWAGALIMGWSPSVIRNDLNGLETSLSVFLSLVVLRGFVPARGEVSGRMAAWYGVLCAALVMARIDSCCLVALLGVRALVAWRCRHAALLIGAGCIAIAPWWITSLVAFGRIVPESGEAVRHLATIMLGFATPALVPPYAALCTLGRLMSDAPFFALVNSGLGFGLLAGAMVIGGGAARAGGARGRVTGAMMATALVQVLFYAFYLRAEWFMPRYLALAECWIVAMAAIGIVAATARLPALSRRPVVAVAILPLLLLMPLGREFVSFFAPHDAVDDAGDPSPKGFREMALEILPHVPRQSVLGALQSGALGYYAGDTVQVRNLDGVVNGKAAAAIATGHAGSYFAEAGIQYFADWESSLRLLRRVWGDHAVPDLVAVAQGERQVDDRVTLYRVVWR